MGVLSANKHDGLKTELKLHKTEEEKKQRKTKNKIWSPHNLAGFKLMEKDHFIYQVRKLRAWLSQENGLSVHTAAAILNLTAAILDLPLSHTLPHVSLNIGGGKRKGKKENKSPTL